MINGISSTISTHLFRRYIKASLQSSPNTTRSLIRYKTSAVIPFKIHGLSIFGIVWRSKNKIFMGPGGSERRALVVASKTRTEGG